MINILKIRKAQGYQAIPDIKKAKIRTPFRGLPVINANNCKKCSICRDLCPSGAISTNPLSIDMGKCIFCGDCERECPENLIRFTNFHKIATDSRESLIITKDITENKLRSTAQSGRAKISAVFSDHRSSCAR